MTTLAGLARPADRNRPSITPYAVVAFLFAMTRGGGGQNKASSGGKGRRGAADAGAGGGGGMMGRRARRLAPLLLLAAAFALAVALLAGLPGMPGTPGAILTPPPASAAHTPTITPSITSTATDSVYSTGDTITIRTTWSTCVASVTSGTLTITIGSSAVSASATGTTTNTTTVDFSHTVVSGNLDQDGISVATGALGGTYSVYPAAACTGTAHAPAATTLTNALASAQSSHAVNTVDYDTDDDGLIEIDASISGVDQLHLMTFNSSGDGVTIENSYYNYAVRTNGAALFNTAYPNRKTNTPNANGCPASGCIGYELTGDVTLDTNNDGENTNADGHSYTTFWGIRPTGNAWTGILEGNGHTISYLHVYAQQPYSGMFARMNGGEIRNLGLVNATASRNNTGDSGLLVASMTGGTITNCYTSGGSVENTTSGSTNTVGGLVGAMSGGTIRDSWSSAAVTSGTYEDASVGGLVGQLRGGSILASYATGAVSGGAQGGVTASALGGLVGEQRGGAIVASYATGAVSSTNSVFAGGLVGAQLGGSINASYATGAVASADNSQIGGLTPPPKGTSRIGVNGAWFRSSGTITDSYWDTAASGVTAGRGQGLTTAELQGATDYTGIYATWNHNTDGAAGPDDPWHFGSTTQYPVLKRGLTLTELLDLYGETPPASDVDYDGNDNSLIDITTLAQLDAVRYDLDGSGADGLTGDALLNYQLAFPGALAGMGCPDGPDADSDPGDCTGYELRADLDFLGSQWTEIGGGGLGHRLGWRPIGGNRAAGYSGSDYTADFQGNGHTISNLYIRDTNRQHVGLFYALVGGDYSGIGLVDADVAHTFNFVPSPVAATFANTGALAGILVNGRVYNSYATGRVVYNGTGAAAVGRTGGLVGTTWNDTGAGQIAHLAACWSAAAVLSQSDSTWTAAPDIAGGLLGLATAGTTVYASYASGAVASTDANREARVGGLVGNSDPSSNINVSYARAPVSYAYTGSGTAGGVAPLNTGSATVADSYYDTDVAGTFASVSGVAKTTTELQEPTTYGAQSTDIYMDWNVDIDGADGNNNLNDGTDDPWDFGALSQYPILKFPGDAGAAARQRPTLVSYDTDGDGLIEIANLAQLNAVRWDVDADGWAASNGRASYRAAFPNGGQSMGCPFPAGCTGYELTGNLDFDTSGDDDVADAPYASWTPIGVDSAGAATAYAGVFEGNRHTISNLRISLSTSTDDGGSYVGLFGDSSGAIRNVGIVNPSISNTRTGGGQFSRTGALVGRNNGGTVSGSWVEGGTVTVSDNTTIGPLVSCLVGFSAGAISDSWSSCAIVGSGSVAGATTHAGGIVGYAFTGGAISGSHATGAITISGASGANAGGLAGRSLASITSSYATGAVTSSSAQTVGHMGGLVGRFVGGDLKASYATGNVQAAGTVAVGGLAGRAELGASNVLQAAYATGTVSRTSSSDGGDVGGLIGQLVADSGRTNVVQATYATGAVSNMDSSGDVGGLVADLETVTAPVSNSYWNNEASGTNQASSAGCGTRCSGQTGSDLQTPEQYGGIYASADWNLDLDSTSGADDPWDFGTNAQYPILQYGHDAISIARQRGISVGGKDYDANDNNLIDIATLDHLNAVRYDLDGDGRSTGADAVGYLAGFPNLTRGMGCPDGCQGYELTAHLDFDTNGDGSVTSADDYESWAHIGNAAADRYDARFVGNGYTIANLTVISGDGLDALFGGITNDAHITGVGLPGVNITSTGPTVGALVGSNAGLVTASWSSGSVEGTNSVGGLVGYMQADTGQEAVLTASWSSATVNATAGNAGGLVGRVRDTGVVNYSYATGAVTATGGTAGGLLGSVASGGTVRASYWNIETGSMIADDANNDPPEGRTTSQLQAPTGYATLYADWNVDVDGDDNVDDPWDFGTASQYPVLKQGASLAWQGRGGFAYTQNNAAATTLTVTEEAADGAAFGVTLAVQPDADVTVTVTSPGGNDVVTLDGPDASAVFNDSEELTFTAANWNTPQTVTLKAATGDDNLVDEMSTLTLTAADAGSDKSGYAGITKTVDVTVKDDDTAAIVLTKSGSAITTLDVTEEAAGGATYDVALSNLPGAQVTVSVTSGTPAKATVSPASLTFTTTNWAMVQTVTVNGLDDADPDDESVTITHLASGAGSGYEDPDGNGPLTAASQTLTVNVEDNDVPKLRVSETALTITEGSTGSFTVRLNSLPTANVSVRITSSNADVKMREGSTGNYVSPLTLTFNRTGGSRLWNAVQTVNVQAGEDPDGDADSASLTFAISGGDYDDVDHDAISVSVNDDDPKGIALSESNLAVSEDRTPASYTVKLDTQPSGAVTVSVTTSGSDRAKVSVSASSGGGFGASLDLSFNAANYGTAQTVYVRGNDDDNTVSEGNISIAHAASGGGYGDPDGNGPMTAVSADLPIMLTDTSRPGLRINPTSLAIKEGTEGEYTVRLTTIPDGSVTVSINRDSGPAVTVDDAGDGNFAGDGTLTFTAGNWNNPQTVKVRAPQVDADETATLSHDASGPAKYTGVTGDLTVNVRDNLPPSAHAGPDQEAYTGQTITLDGSGSSDPDDDDSTLSYSWRQTTLADTRPISLIRANTARASFAVPTDLSADTEVEFELTVTDGAGVSDTDTVKAKLLAARPNELVSLTVTAGSGDDAVQRPLTPPFASIQRSFDSYVGAYTTTAQIRMTPADPGASVSLNGDNPPAIGARTVRVSLAEGHNRFTIVVSPRPIEAGGQPLQPVTYRLNIRRQRAPRLAFEPERLLLSEGASAAYTVALDTRWLGAEVVITITSDNPDVTVAPAQVSISQHDWSARTITVTASDDADGDDDFATLRHLANGGQFNNVGGRVWVEVSDDDEPTSPEPTPTPTPAPGQTPTPGPSPTPGPTPTPTPMPTPTPLPGLPTIATTFTTEVPVDGQMVTITREAGSLAGVTLALPAMLTRNLWITIAPLPDDIPLSSSRYGLGMTPAAQSGAALTVTGAPAGGLHLCLPLSDALVSEAGSRPLTLVHYESAGWQSLPGAERRGDSVCASGVATGVFAAAYALPQLGPASDLTVAAGDGAGTLALRWTPGANATRHWIAGIKQTDWDAGDFSNLIWTAASGADTHTVSGLDSGAEYVFAVAAGRGSEWSAWTALARGTAE